MFNYLQYIPDELLCEELREDKRIQKEVGASISTIISLFAEATDKHLEDTIMSGMIETLNNFADSVDELLEEKKLNEYYKKTPLLTIELDDINSVPKVIYKGEEVKKKVRVTFDWETKNSYYNPTHIHIEHAEVEDNNVCIKSITHNPYM